MEFRSLVHKNKESHDFINDPVQTTEHLQTRLQELENKEIPLPLGESKENRDREAKYIRFELSQRAELGQAAIESTALSDDLDKELEQLIAAEHVAANES